MKRRDFIAANAALFGAGTIVGFGLPRPLAAQEAPVPGGTLIWGHSENTQNLNVFQTGTAASLRVLQNVHAPLVTVDATLATVPNLAESFTVSDDGLTYEFRLRQGLTFHSGAPVTAADVKYSFGIAASKDAGSSNFDAFSEVTNIETPDDATIIVTMGKPKPAFLSRISEIGAGAVIPVDSAETQGTNPVGAGPFRFVSYEVGSRVEMERFDGYWEGPALLEKLVAREITEPTTRLTGLRTGELHMINDIPADRVKEISETAGMQTHSWFPLNFDFINLNHQFEPFKDVRVRQAIDMLIDKEMLLQGALWGQGQTTATPSYPTSSSYNGALKQRPQDIEGAQALLAEAGYPSGSLNLTIKVTTNYPYHVETAQILVEWFRMAGVGLKIEQLTFADWLSQVSRDRDFELTMINFFTLWEPDRLYYRLWNTDGRFNFRSIEDPVIDQLTSQAAVEIVPAGRDQLYKDVQQRIFDDAHDVILWFRNGSIGAAEGIMGLDTVVHPNGSSLNFHKVWMKS